MEKLLTSFFDSAICNEDYADCKLINYGRDKSCYQLNDNYVLKTPKGLIELLTGNYEIQKINKNNKINHIIFDNNKKSINKKYDADFITVSNIQIDNELKIYKNMPEDIKKYFAKILYFNKVVYNNVAYWYYVQEKINVNVCEDYKFINALEDLYGVDKTNIIIKDISNCFKNSTILVNDFLYTHFNFGYNKNESLKIFDFGFDISEK